MSGFRRRLMMARKTKPYDAEVEYIETDGSAYINTGIKASSNVKFNLLFYAMTNSATYALFGGRIGNNNNQLGIVVNNNATISWRYGNTGNDPQSFSSGYWSFKNLSSSNSLISNGYTTSTTAATFSTNIDCYLFTLNNNNEDFWGIISGTRSYGGKIYENDVLVRDYIPVRRNGIGYLYDRVTKTLFGNANSVGSFIVGNDVPYTTEIEYIETNDNSYINTGVKISSNTKFDFTFYCPKVEIYDVSYALFGGRIGNGNSQLFTYVNLGTKTIVWRYNKYSKDGSSITTGTWTFSNTGSSNTLIANGTSTVAGSGTFTTDLDFFIFACNNNGAVWGGYPELRFNEGMLYNGTTLVRYYIPVRIGQVGYLYDKVSKTLFGNANSTGAFLIGNDK